MIRFLSCLACFAVLPACLLADDRWNRSVETAIDHFIESRLAVEKVTPAPRAEDAVLLRRMMLDLVGRPPSATEARQFLGSNDPFKWSKLVDALVGSAGYIRHQTNEFDTFLMQGSGGSLRGYLQDAFAKNLPWDQVFRELISAESVDTKRKGAEQFLKTRVKDLDKLTNAASVAFFGINVSCAKCHDHPIVSNWTQDHFYGMKSFFSRTFANGDFVGERNYGLVSFKTTAGKSKTARLMFLTGTALQEPPSKAPSGAQQKKEKQRLEQAKKKKQPPPKPVFSRRSQLIEVALRPNERHFFARSIVNRVWGRLHGRGLVMPLDQMHPENTPSHPQLLEWLAKDFIAHKYDLSRLIRGMVKSKAYTRSSRWAAPSEAPDPELFAVAPVRPLTPFQYAVTLKLASSNPESLEQVKTNAAELRKRIEGIENAARGMVSWFEQPTEGFQISVTEALLLTNSDRVRAELTRDDNGSLVGRLKRIESSRKIAEAAIWNVFSRPPRDGELEILTDYLNGRQARVSSIQQLVWALLTSSENRFNY